MTVEVSGIASAQARVQEIQNRLSASTQNSVRTDVNSTSRSAGSFGASLAKASAAPATAAAPFVWDPSAAPGQAVLKPGAAAALRAPVPAASIPAASSAPAAGVGATASSAVAATSAVGGVGGVGAVAGTSKADAVLATAKKYLGVPYKWGGTNPAVGLDCSGFVQLVFRQHGYNLPRVARDQQQKGTPVASLAEAKPGDLVTFGKPATHIGIYVGDGKMIHAPRTGDVVKISPVHKNLSSIRRILPEGSDVPQPVQGGGAGLPATAIDASAVRAAVASASANAAAVSGASSSGLGGWSGTTPAPDTWGAAVAAATGSAATASTTPAVSAVGASAVGVSTAVTGGPLAQAPAALQTLFVEAGRKYGVSAQLLAAVAKQESNFKTTAVSHAGARGLMQLMPGTARGLGVKNSFDPAQAVDGAARLLRDHLKTFGSTQLALAAYNAGPGAVRRYDGVPPYAETQNYVRKIMANLSTAGV